MNRGLIFVCKCKYTCSCTLWSREWNKINHVSLIHKNEQKLNTYHVSESYSSEYLWM